MGRGGVEAVVKLSEPAESCFAIDAAPTSDSTELPAYALLLVAGIAVLSVSQGGFYWRPRVIFEVLTLIAGVIAVVLHRRRGVGPAWAALLGIGALAVSTIATGILSGHPSGVPAEIGLIVALGIVVYLVAGLGSGAREQLTLIIVGVAVFLAATAWIGVAWHVRPLAHVDGGLWRAATTITYANASAAALTMSGLFAFALLLAGPSTSGVGWAHRNQYCLLRLSAMIVVTGLGATLSRAGLGAFAAGLVVICFLIGPGQIAVAIWPSLIGAAVAAIGLLPGAPSPGPTKPVWAVLAVLAGMALAVAPWPEAWTTLRRDRRRVRPAALAGLVVTLAVVVGLAIGLAHQSGAWSGRLSLASPDRHAAGSAAWKLFVAHPLAGVGPGKSALIWTENGHLVLDHYAHDEYVQLAAEQGSLGLVALAALVAGVGWTTRRGWKSAPTPLRAAAVAALVTFAIHSGFDFLWHIPIVAVIAAVAIGLGAPSPAPGSSKRNPIQRAEEAPNAT